MKTTYHGSCHCRAVTYEVDIDLANGTKRCNCTLCWKQRMWEASVDSADFRLISGGEMLGDYARSGDWGEAHHRFCARCGIATHSHGNIAAMGGAFATVHLSTLDDMPVEDLVAAPIRFMDGLHDAWERKPSETRHL